MHLFWGIRHHHVGSAAFIFTTLLTCWAPASSMTISLPSASQTHMMYLEEEKEERNSNLSAQHFLPGNPQTQAFPRPTSVDRTWSWILAGGQLWCARIRVRVRTRAGQESQIGEWILRSEMIYNRWLVYWYELWEREHERGPLNALTRAENSEGGLIYCLPSVALSEDLLSFCLVPFHSGRVLNVESLLHITGVSVSTHVYTSH